MICAGYTKVWDLAPGELVQLDGARGTTLRVTRGTLWITQERDTRDIVLSAGDAFTIDRGGLHADRGAGERHRLRAGAPRRRGPRARARRPTFGRRVAGLAARDVDGRRGAAPLGAVLLAVAVGPARRSGIGRTRTKPPEGGPTCRASRVRPWVRLQPDAPLNPSRT